MPTPAAHPRCRRHRLTAVWLPTLVLTTVTLMGAYHLIFGVRAADLARWRAIWREESAQEAPKQIEADLNVRFIPGMAARTLAFGVPIRAMQPTGGDHVIGSDGFVFVREDLAVAYGRSFVDPREHRPRDAAATLVAFSKRMRERGIHFIVMPVPAKVTICPDRVDPEYKLSDGPLLNKGHHAWIDSLRSQGVEVIDVTDALWARRGEAPLFFATDTHWTQFAMRVAAASIAPRVDELVGDAIPRQRFEQKTFRHAMRGDISNRPSTMEEDVVEEQVRLVFPQASPDLFGDDAPVLILGDSYAEQFARNQAGFAQMLSLETGLPVQSAAQFGVQASQMVRQATARPELLTKKRVVLLAFSIRKIQCNDW